MAGPIHGRIECVICANTEPRCRNESFATIYGFLKKYKTLESVQYGSSGTGDGYWDDVNPPGQTGHFGDNCFAVFYFPPNAGRTWGWRLFLQTSINSGTFGVSPGDPGTMYASAGTTGFGLQAAVAFDGSGVEFNPWMGFARTDGKARKCAAWSNTYTYSLGDRVMYAGLIYGSLQNTNLNKQPDTNPAWWTALTTLPAAWVATKFYSPPDRVSVGGNSMYQCIQPGRNITPAGNPTYWTQVTAQVWGVPPGVASGTVLVLPRSNTGIGAHCPSKHNCSRESSFPAGPSNWARTNFRVWCDDDSFAWSQSYGTYNYHHLNSITYIGPYKPIHGTQVRTPLVMISNFHDGGSTVQPVGAPFGDQPGSNAYSCGGIVTARVGDPVLTAYADKITTQTFYQTYSPNLLNSIPEWGEFPLPLYVNDVPPSPFPANQAIVGFLDTPLLRMLASTGIDGSMSTNKRRLVLGNTPDVSNLNQHWTVPWDGVTGFLSGSHRYGVDF